MSDDPYKPPESDPATRTPDVPGSPLRAVLTGLTIDIGGSAVLGIVLGQVYGWTLSGPDVTQAQINDAVAHLPLASPFGVLGLLLGSLMSVLGGFVCARIVLRNEYRAGFAMAAVSVLFGLMVGDGGSDDADQLTGLLILCTVACNLLGVKYGAEYNRRLEAAAVPPADRPVP
jgi:hypothetical protein